MSKFQQGGLNAKRVRDHLFLLREVMDHEKTLGEKVWSMFNNMEVF